MFLGHVMRTMLRPPPLCLQIGARQTMKNTAEKSGVEWSNNVSSLEKSGGWRCRWMDAGGLTPLLLPEVLLPWHLQQGKGPMLLDGPHAPSGPFVPACPCPALPCPCSTLSLPPRCLPAEVYQIKEEIEDRNMTYPAYYTVPFHGGWVGR